MKRLQTTLNHARLGSLAVGLALFSAGCSTVGVVRTAALPGLPSVGDPDQVKIVEEGKPVNQPYQPVGALTVWLKGDGGYGNKMPDKDFSYKRMKELAAATGADGVIGVHECMGVCSNAPFFLRGGLAVKWLAADEARRPVAKPFVIAVLPLAVDAEKTNNQPATPTPLGKHATPMAPLPPKTDYQDKLTAAVAEAVRVPLELKGYYVLPAGAATYKGGLEGVRNLGDAEIRSVGGDDAQLLLDVSVTSRANATLIIQSTASANVKSTLLDKATRSDVFQGAGGGTFTAGWIVNMVADKRIFATGVAASESLKTLQPVGEELGK